MFVGSRRAIACSGSRPYPVNRHRRRILRTRDVAICIFSRSRLVFPFVFDPSFDAYIPRIWGLEHRALDDFFASAGKVSKVFPELRKKVL
jgi:hypothetical protein